MKVKTKAIIFNVLLAFIISIITTFFIFPQFREILLTNISQVPQLSIWNFLKIFSSLLAQTSILWLIFYKITTKLF